MSYMFTVYGVAQYIVNNAITTHYLIRSFAPDLGVTESTCCHIAMLIRGLGCGLFPVDPITGWSVTPVDIASATNTDAVFNVSVTGGTNMTIEMIDESSGDDMEAQWAAKVEDVAQISHVFVSAKRYTLMFRISNDASQANTTLTYDVDDVINVSSSTIAPTRPYEECLLMVRVNMGSRLQYYVKWDDEFSAASSNGTSFVARHNFNYIGDYEVHVSIQNSVSMSNFSATAYVRYEITDLTLSQVDYSDAPSLRNVTFLGTIRNGSHVTVVTDFGNGYVTVEHYVDAPLSIEFSYAYDSIGDYTLVVDYQNHVSTMSRNISFAVNVAITGFRVDAPEYGVIDQELRIILSVASGNPVHYVVTGTNGSEVTTLLDSTPSVAGYLTAVDNVKFITAFTALGDNTVRATASNIINGTRVESLKTVHVEIYNKITGVTASTDKGFNVRTDDNITFTVLAATGSLVTVAATFGDGTASVTQSHGKREAEQAPVEFVHAYTSVGNYTANFMSSNKVGGYNISLPELVIQVPVSGIRLRGPLLVSVPDNGRVEYNVTMTGTPSNPFCHWTFADGTAKTVFDTFLPDILQDVQVFTYDESMTGEQAVVVNCSNLVSSGQASATVMVQRCVEDVRITVITPEVAVSQTAMVKVTARKGSHLQFTIDFRDGNTTTLSHSDQLNSTTAVAFQHVYTVAGNYTVHVTASNNVSSLNVTAYVIVQQPLNRGDIELKPNTTRRPTSVPSFKFAIAVANGQKAQNMPTDIYVSSTFPGSDTYTLFAGNKWPFHFERSFVGIPAGNVTLIVTLSNRVSSETFNVTVQLQELISGLSVRAPPFAVKDEQVIISVKLEAGSDIVGKVDFGDNKAIETIPGEHINKTFNLTHEYDTAGTFQVVVTLKNDIRTTTNVSNELIVQKRVGGLVLVGDVFVKIPDGKLRLAIERQEYEPVQTPFTITVSYGQEEPKHIQSNFSSPFNLSHEFKKLGAFTVHVNVSNNVSIQSLSRYIEVHEAITGVVLSSQLDGGDITTGSTTCIIFQKIACFADIETGTNVSLLWTFGDGRTQHTNIDTIAHTYTEVGEYDVTVKASNPVEPGVIATLHILVLSPLGIKSFTYNDTATVNSSVPFVVHLNGTRDEICVEYKFTDDTDTILLWIGTSQELCRRASMFVVNDFQKISTETNHAQPVTLLHAFQRVTAYNVQVTVLSSTNETLVTDGEVTITERDNLCLKPNVTVKENGNSAANPIITKRSEDMVVSNNNFEITKYEVNGGGVPASIAAELKWEMFEYDNVTGEHTPATFEAYGIATPTTVIEIPKQTLPYGMYTFTMTVTLKEFSQCSDRDSIFVSIVSTPLEVNIKFGAFRVVGYNTPIEMNAADVSRDPAAKKGSVSGLTYEWRCRKGDEDDSSTVVEIPGLCSRYSYNIQTLPFGRCIYTLENMNLLSNPQFFVILSPFIFVQIVCITFLSCHFCAKSGWYEFALAL